MVVAEMRMDRMSKQEGLSRRFSHLTILAVLVILSILLALVTAILSDTGIRANIDFGVMLTFLINAVLGITFLMRSVVERPFSLVQVHWLFYVTMFVISPASQYLYDYSAWGYVLSSYDYQVTNALLFVWGSLFALVTNVTKVRSGFRKESSELFDNLPKVSGRASIVVFLSAAIATLLVVSTVGLGNLFSRGTYSTGLDKTSGLLFDKALRPLPVFAFAILYIRYRQSRRGAALLAGAGLMMLLADFPTAMARYSAATLYGGLALLVFDTLRTKRGLFPALLLVAFLVVFPASNVYRYSAFDFSVFLDSLSGAFAGLSRGFCAVDYDAYSMIPRTMHYVGTSGATSGFQLLSVLLFFVPRSIWPMKSNGSGYLVAAAQGQSQLNVSCPLPAEGIVNFGVIGLAAFALVVALMCRRADEAYRLGEWGGLRVFYPFACLMFFFMMRGDLLSSFAFLCGYTASFLAVWLMVLVLSADSYSSQKAG